MNRAERRRNKREKEKLSKSIDKLTPNQLKLINMYSEQKANILLDAFKQLVTKSMRQNRISLQRANKVIEDANKIMDTEVNNIGHK